MQGKATTQAASGAHFPREHEEGACRPAPQKKRLDCPFFKGGKQALGLPSLALPRGEGGEARSSSPVPSPPLSLSVYRRLRAPIADSPPWFIRSFACLPVRTLPHMQLRREEYACMDARQAQQRRKRSDECVRADLYVYYMAEEENAGTQASAQRAGRSVKVYMA